MVVAVAHVGLAAVWLGSMLYSLLIVQPRVTRLLAADDDLLEDVLTRLGAGNRRPVLAIVAALLLTAPLLAVAVDADGAQIPLIAVDGALVLVAGAVFARVSWRLWPHRVFALPEERPAHRAVLRRHALTMVALIGTAFTCAVAALALS